MSYDADRDRVVLFGGRQTSSSGTKDFSDTWEFDGTEWLQVADSGPSPRSFTSLTYDLQRKKTVLFGGSQGALPPYADTWEWDGGLWTQVADSGPKNTGHALLAYDATNGYALAYTANATRLETWSWNGTLWTQLDDVGASTAMGTMAFNLLSKQVTFCTDDGSATSPIRTYVWTGSGWRQVSEIGPNASTSRSQMACDGKELLLYVGDTGVSQTWAWNGSEWVQRQDIGPQRPYFAMTGDTKRNRCVLFGGSPAYGDTWALRRLP